MVVDGILETPVWSEELARKKQVDPLDPEKQAKWKK
jgi:hypothetical protein